MKRGEVMVSNFLKIFEMKSKVHPSRPPHSYDPSQIFSNANNPFNRLLQ
jgi:hypothetical protein